MDYMQQYTAFRARVDHDEEILASAVQERVDSRGNRRLILYIVPGRAYSRDKLRRDLDVVGLTDVLISTISRIPRREDGAVDDEVLFSLPTLDEHSIQSLTLEFESNPAILEAVVDLAPHPITPKRLWLPEFVIEQSVPGVSCDHLSADPEQKGESKIAFARGPEQVTQPSDTLAERLLSTARMFPEKGVRFVGHHEGDVNFLSYADLARRARAVANGLLRPGHVPRFALLQCPTSPDYFVLFWGCLLAGVCPVTVALSPDYGEDDAVSRKLTNTWSLLQLPPILTTQAMADRLHLWSGRQSEVPQILTIEILEEQGAGTAESLPSISPNDVAFCQLSSGSTGTPKCIQETHKGVLSHIEWSAEVNGYSSSDVTLNWLPMDHVVPLLTFHIRSTCLGCSQIELSTSAVLQDPTTWLDAINAYRVTHTWAPNFGLRLVSSRVDEVEGYWDLSSLRMLLNAGEQVTMTVVQDFIKKLTPYGLCADVVQPAFGMAEVCTCMTYKNGVFGVGSSVSVDKRSLAGELKLVPDATRDACNFVSLGPPMPGVEIRITDQSNEPMTELRIGRLQIRGGVVTPGYIANPQANAAAFVGDGWFNTGDLGFIYAGELYMTGRESETIVVQGVNHYCHEIEDCVQNCVGVAPTYAAAIAVPENMGQTEGVAICFVPQSGISLPDVLREITRALSREYGIEPSAIIPLALADFPKTTSGKIQRRELQTMFSKGQFQQSQKESDLILMNRRTLPSCVYEERWERVLPAGSTVDRETLVLVSNIDTGFSRDSKAFPQHSVVCEYRIDSGSDGIEIISSDVSEAVAVAKGRLAELRRVVIVLPPMETYGLSVVGLLDSQVRLLKVQASIFHTLDTALQGEPEIIFLTRGASPIHGDKTLLSHVAVRGWLSSAEREYPRFKCRQIDLKSVVTDADFDSLKRVLALSRLPGKLCAIDNDHCWIPCWKGINPPSNPEDLRSTFRVKGFYVVTGGLGGIGFEIVSDLVQRLGADVLIVGRTLEEDVEGEGLKALRLRRLRSHGTKVHYLSLVEPDLEIFEALVERTEEAIGRRVDGLIHLAGVTSHQMVADFSSESAREVMEAKVAGTRLMCDFAVRRGDLSLVVFTSVNAVIGGRGMSTYGAASSFQLGYMREILREGRVRSAHCIAWSAWQGVGMSADGTQKESALAALGLELLSSRDAIPLLDVVLHQPSGDYLVGIRRGAPETDLLIAGEPQLVDFPTVHYVSDSSKSDEICKLLVQDHFGVRFNITANRWPQLPLNADGQVCHDVLRANKVGRHTPRGEVEAKLHDIFARLVRGESLAYDDDFFERGFDSIRLAEAAGQTARQLGVNLSMETLFRHPSVESLATHLSTLKPCETTTAVLASSEDEQKPFPLSPIQESYLVGRDLDFDLGGVAAHVYREFDVEDLHLPRLERALNKTIAEVPMMRASFLAHGEQRVLRYVPHYTIQVDDLRGKADGDRSSYLDMHRSELSVRKGALEWPLFHVSACRIDDRVTRLYVDIDMLIADWLSIRLIMNFWIKHYRGQVLDASPAVTFRDCFVSTLAENAKSIELSRSYWAKRVANFSGAPRLPMVGRPSVMSSRRFHRRQVRLDRECWAAFVKTARAGGVTPTSALLTLFCLTIERYSSAPEFALILTLFNRPPIHPDINLVVGDFTSTLLFEHSPQAKATFVDLARSHNKDLWMGLDHRQYDGVSVLRDLLRAHQDNPEWVRPGVVFTSTLGLDQLCGEDLAISEFGREVFGISQTPQVWLDQTVLEEAGELVVNWDSVDELFPDGFLDDMFESYSRALELLADSKHWDTELVIELPEGQRSRREQINATAGNIPSGMLFDDFLEHANSRPDAPAVITEEREVSYGELAQAAHAVAAAVSSAGVARGQLVGIALEKGWEQVACALGIQMAGAAYLPLDPLLPHKRLQELEELGQLELVLTDEALASQWGGVGRARVLVWQALDVSGDSAFPRVTQTPSDLAYVIFTSGSTGVPKGVMISHQSALNTVRDINHRYRVNGKSRVFGISSLSFDLSVYDIFGPLSVGGALVLPNPEHSRDPERWVNLIDIHGVTLWNSAPALMDIMVDWLVTAGRICPSVNTVMMSGDWIPVSLPDRIRTVLPNASLHSLGGATEGSIWSITYPIADVAPSWSSIPYGKPLQNQKMYVLDKQLRDCPDWVQGEIYIGGIGVALGYWRDSERTAAQFIERPSDRQRLYRTGDLGRMLPDGNIEFLGRCDSQVQVNGYRVELGEIEAALDKHPDITKALVDYRDVGSQKALVAFVVGTSEVPGEVLRAWLGKRLPEYMVPKYVVPLAEIPLTQNGKVVRSRLPEPQLPTQATHSARQVETGVEAVIGEVLSGLAGFEIRDTGANFFDLGLTSRTLVLAATRIGVGLGRQVPPVHLFRFPTIQHLARSLSETQVNEDKSSRPNRGALARAALERAARANSGETE